MESFNLLAPSHLVDTLTKWMTYYDYKYEIKVSDKNSITRMRKTGEKEYANLQEFLLNEIFYKNKKNLHYYPIANPKNVVCNFDIGLLDIVTGHPLLSHLLVHPVFKKFVVFVHNYAPFIRFSGNKAQRLYWNPPLNAGLPLTEKEKDPVYELIFLMHDFGHFLLPDLIFTGKISELSRKIYVNWRLLGESITVVLNEMLLVDYLKDTAEFKELLKIGYDHPYKLYQRLGSIDLKELFYASYLYFCLGNKTGFLTFIKDESDPVWTQFDQRYHPVAARGREWTESNYENISQMSADYSRWYDQIKIFKNYLDLKTIDQMEKLIVDHSDHKGCGLRHEQSSEIRDFSTPEVSDLTIVKVLFDYAWKNLLYPLFHEGGPCPPLNPLSDRLFSKESDGGEISTIPWQPSYRGIYGEISPSERKERSFVRYFVGNLFLLIKFDINAFHVSHIKTLLMNLSTIEGTTIDENIADLQKIYIDHVDRLYQEKMIDMNEYYNYKDIFIMIPPNILKKDSY